MGVLSDLCGPNQVSVSSSHQTHADVSVLSLIYLLYFILGLGLDLRRPGQAQSDEAAF